MTLNTLLTVVVMLMPVSLSAKGLEELTPEVDKKEDDAPAADAKSEGAADGEGAAAPADGEAKPDAGTKPPADCLKKDEKAEGEEDEDDEEQTDAECPAPAEAAPPPLERSALSKKLDNKLYLGTGAGLLTLGGRSGTWSTSANGEMEAGYLVKQDALPFLKGTDIWATLRYDAIDVVVEENRQSYRGIVQGYHFGAKGMRPWNERVKVVGAVELGMLTTHLDPTDIFEKDEGLEKSGVNLTLSGGCDWTFLEKVTVGPRFALGFGSLQTVRLAGAATFGF